MPYVRIGPSDVLLTRGGGRLKGLPARWRGLVAQLYADEIVARGAGVVLAGRGEGAQSAAALDAIERRMKDKADAGAAAG